MDTRYHIEELVSQDARGVVFQGVDTITGVVVAMRRFISASIDSGNGRNDGAQDYEDAIESLKKVSHPSLRRVLAGGCDPVDGMPYLVTRWIDGIPLGELVAIEGPLDPGVVILILAKLLNANITLSKALGSEGFWAETSLDSVLIQPPTAENEDATAIFWVSPWRWLDEGAAKGGAMELADFAEAMLGGPRHVATHYAGSELAAWIQNIRNKKLVDLREIQEALNAPGTPVSPFVLQEPEKPSPSPKVADAPAIKVVPPQKHQPSASPPKTAPGPRTKALPATKSTIAAPPRSGGKKAIGFVFAALLVVALIGGVAWMLRNQNEANTEAPYRASPSNQSQEQSSAEMPVAESARLDEQGYYTITQGDLLLARAGEEVTLRGNLARVRFSSSGLTMYLEFSENAPIQEPRVYAMAGDLVDGIRAEELETLIGSRVEIQGVIDIENVSAIQRPRIRLMERSQITLLEAQEDYELR